LVVPYDPATGFRHLMEAALEDHVPARYEVAQCFQFGRGTDLDPDKAEVWYARTAVAMEDADPAALDDETAWVGALCLRDGRGVPHDYRQAARWFLHAAKSGNHQALYETANFYALGLGVARNPERAVALYARAGAAGNAHACLALARHFRDGLGVAASASDAETWRDRAIRIMTERAALGSVADAVDLYLLFDNGDFIEPDPARGLAWLRRAADQGFPPALMLLGKAYALGNGVDRDAVQGLDTLRRAAAQNDADAHFLLWKMLRSGDGEENDLREAIGHLEQSARGGNLQAMQTLGDWYRLYSDDPNREQKMTAWYQRALEDFEILAQRGHAPSMTALVVMYGRGRGVEADARKAFFWLRQAAEAGVADAQLMMATAYENGLEVGPDPQQAVDWYRRAAEQDYIPALLRLAAVLERGAAGVDPDPDQAESLQARAFELARRAAAAGDAEAQYLLATLYRKGRGGTRSSAEAVRWLQRAAEQGHVRAQLDLGIAYVHGAGVERDAATGLHWVYLASRQGQPEAQFLLGKAYDTSEAVKRDYVESYKWMFLASRKGFEPAKEYLEELAITLSDPQIAEAKRRALLFMEEPLALADEAGPAALRSEAPVFEPTPGLGGAGLLEE
jgi:TPR repeat protein